MALINRKKNITLEEESMLKILQESYNNVNKLEATIKLERTKAMKQITNKDDMIVGGKYVNDLLRHETNLIDKKIKIVEVLKEMKKGNNPDLVALENNDDEFRKIAREVFQERKNKV